MYSPEDTHLRRDGPSHKSTRAHTHGTPQGRSISGFAAAQHERAGGVTREESADSSGEVVKPHRKAAPSNLRAEVKTTVRAGMLRPVEKVSVAKRARRRPSWKRISTTWWGWSDAW